MKTAPILVVVLLLAPEATRAADAPEFPGESAPLGRRFEELSRKEDEARKKGSETLWREFLDELQTMLTTHGNELAVVDKQRVVQVRRVVQERLSRLPPEALRLYQQQADAQAQKWLDEGRRNRDVRLLRRVVEDAFATESASVALERLGDLAFEQGRFDEAESWWRYLAPPLEASKEQAQQTLLHPDHKSLEASAQARQLLARWFAGQRAHREEWDKALTLFRQRHPDSAGHLAGARDLYWKRLQEVSSLDSFKKDSEKVTWPTFGGAVSRNRILHADVLDPDSLGQLLQDGLHHTIPLGEARPVPSARAVIAPSEAARSLAFHPVIAGGKVLIADASKVRAIDPKSGKADVWFDAAPLGGFTSDERVPPPADSRFTLTAAADCVLARLGEQTIRADRKDNDREGASYLVCLNVQPDDKGQRLRWRAAFGGPKENTIVEGAPLVDRDRVFAAVTRFEGNQAYSSIHCYALEAKGIASPIWKRDTSIASDGGNSDPRRRHHLLTLGGSLLFYCTHDGAVVAVEADSGRFLWGVRYREERVVEDTSRLPVARGVNPCIYVNGRLYVAPADSDLLLCLDPMTGRVLWERDRIEVTQLLGVAGSRLFFSTRTPEAGFRAINAVNGSDKGGWFRSGSGFPVHSFGRGLLAGDCVIWPTLRHVYLLRQEDGEIAADTSLTARLSPGNLAFGEGTLVVAGREKLHLFTPPRVKKDEPKKEVKEKSASR